MSSPLSNLKKGKKTPFINATRTAPFKPTAISEDELISQLNVERKLHIMKTAQADGGGGKGSSGLMSSMITRLSEVEKKLTEYEKIIKEKDKQIHILEDKCAIYQRAKGYGNDQIAELERKCHKLQHQVHSMENFLEDYGMIWVGNPNSSDEEYVDDDGDDEGDENNNDNGSSQNDQVHCRNLFGTNTTWNPEFSISQGRRVFFVDFDLVLKNIKELNALAGEGEHYIQHTKDGARLQVKEPVPLILYSNGIFMFGGPFRPYDDPTTQEFIQDIMNGYFPSEFKGTYPDGVPIRCTDKRDMIFKDKRLESLFPGHGQTLSPEKGQKDVSTTTTFHNNISDERAETIDKISSHRQSVEQFLSKLPSSVMKNGNIIDIREGLKETLQGTKSKNEVIVIETDAVKDITARVNSARRSRPSTAASVTTLRIKSESGERTYMLKMRYTDTIKDVKHHLNVARGDSSTSYLLKTSFPNQTYTDLKKSLKEYGLVPNATMYIVRNLPSTVNTLPGT